MEYSGYRTVTINDLGRRKVETKNALGEVVSVTDNELGSANEVSSVSYAYDPQGNMTTLTDSAGNISTIHYDLLGRKEWMDDPDKGCWRHLWESSRHYPTALLIRPKNPDRGGGDNHHS